MKRRGVFWATVRCVLATCVLATGLPALAAPAVRRFALVAGANYGGSGRPQLKYAVSDAERFARVLTDLGGVASADAVVLKQPSLRELEEAFTALGRRVAGGGRGSSDEGSRTEVLVYYSGHADESGLLLGDDRYSYRTLRDRLDAIPADVRIAVLDACASGAITRIKGGQARQPFLVDGSSSMRGHAFLTSSSADEAAQESDRVGASYFTHFLISGLRGAADVSGEGMVTLSEAYQFAFRETLGRTVETRGGAQHPSYDINLTGTGDVIMTDLRQTSASLVLDEAVAGRCFVRDAGHALVVELRKPKDRPVELGLEPGRYEVSCQDETAAVVATPILHEGARVVLGPNDFTPTRREATVRRGSGWQPGIGELNGRNRFEIWTGARDSGSHSLTGVVGRDRIESRSFSDEINGLGYTRWIRPKLALSFVYTFDEAALISEVSTAQRTTNESSSLQSYAATVRRDMPSFLRGLKPYASAGVGVYERSVTLLQSTTAVVVTDEQGDTSRSQASSTESHFEDRLGARIAGGFDWQTSYHYIWGVSFSYDFIPPFRRALGGPRDYSGWQYGFHVGWLFGRGTPPPK